MLYPFLIVLHVIICLFLILLVLIQSDKGGGLAGALGGMGGGAAFSGSSAANIITRVTQGTALVSFVLILALNVMSSNQSNAGPGESELKQSNTGYESIFPQGYNSTSQIPGLQQAADPEAELPPVEESAE